ncbi:MAG: methyltransferase, TIGR04325 family [Pseudomonadota bacterium]
MSALNSLARDWLPPAVHRAVGRWRASGSAIRFEGEFATWQEAAARCAGYEASHILGKVLAATLEVKRGEAIYERDSVLFHEIDYNWPVAAGLLWAAGRSRGRLTVLDFGGALGSSYYQNRGLLEGLAHLRWNVVEQPHYVAVGRAQVQDETLRFHDSIDACARESAPNAVLLSSVLQYLEDPRAVLEQAMRMEPEVIVVDRTIVNDGPADRIYMQRVPASIYRASYPCRSLSESNLVAALEGRYRLAASFASLEFPALRSIASSFRGFLFHKAAG